MNNNIDNNTDNTMNNQNNSINSHSGHKTGKEIYHTQELNRNKYQTELNVYHDKK